MSVHEKLRDFCLSESEREKGRGWAVSMSGGEGGFESGGILEGGVGF